MKISGEIVYMNLEGGFWGITTPKQNYFPIYMHEQLKSQGTNVTCQIEILDDMMTMQSWGVPCRIVSFTTLGL